MHQYLKHKIRKKEEIQKIHVLNNTKNKNKIFGATSLERKHRKERKKRRNRNVTTRALQKALRCHKGMLFAFAVCRSLHTLQAHSAKRNGGTGGCGKNMGLSS